MSGALARLNLRPQEERLLVVIAVVLFGVLNLWFVWPHFGDWSRVKGKLAKARATLADYRKELAQEPEYRKRLSQLEKQGSSVLPAEQARQLESTILNEARRSGVVITHTTPVETPRQTAGKTNQFFEEQTARISVSTGERELVNFLYALGSDNSMVRVRDMDLRPDPGSRRTRLMGNLTLVASYQKKAKAKVNANPVPPRRPPALRRPRPTNLPMKSNPRRPHVAGHPPNRRLVTRPSRRSQRFHRPSPHSNRQ